MERKLGVLLGCLRGTNEITSIPYLKAAGFECCFTNSYMPDEVVAVRKATDAAGMELSFVHGAWWEHDEKGKRRFMNELWYEDGAYESLYNKVIASIDATAEAGVKTVVLHLTEGWQWQSPRVTDIGLARFDAIVEHAVKRGVHIAFENLFTLGTLAAMMERYERVPEVGFCYDNGHEHCYLETVPYLDLYGKRALCVHLHDNYGRDKNDIWKDADYHLLPFDGTFDFATMMRKLDKYGYAGPLIMEVGPQHGKYADMSNEEYAAYLFSLVNRIANAHKQ